MCLRVVTSHWHVVTCNALPRHVFTYNAAARYQNAVTHLQWPYPDTIMISFVILFYKNKFCLYLVRLSDFVYIEKDQAFQGRSYLRLDWTRA